MKTHIAFILSFSGALVLTGCDTVNTVDSSTTHAPVGVVLREQRVVTDQYLHEYLMIGNIIGYTVSGLQRISTTLTNNRDVPLDVAYKVEWLDCNGALIESPTGGWKRLHFEGRETISFAEVAISPKAADFRLKFQQQ